MFLNYEIFPYFFPYFASDSRGRTYLYNYDTLGRLICMSEYKGSYIVQNMSTEYDTSNRVNTLTYKVDPNLGGTLEPDRSYGYTYDCYKKAESVQKT